MKARAAAVGPCYIVDSSAWIALQQRSDFEKAWAFCKRLILAKRLVTAPEILKELAHKDHRDTSEIYKRLREHESIVRFRKTRDQSFHDTLGWLHLKYPRMCKSRSRNKRPADPYVIATASRSGFVVVSEETLQRKPSTKIPHACVALGIRCLTLDELFLEESGD